MPYKKRPIAEAIGRCQNQSQIFSVKRVEPATTKYMAIWKSETKPSILSKLLQKALPGFSAKMSAKRRIPIKTATAPPIKEIFGLYSGGRRAKSNKAEKIQTEFFWDRGCGGCFYGDPSF